MDDLKQSVDELAELMNEFRLQEAEVSGLDWRVVLRRRTKTAPATQVSGESSEVDLHDEMFVENFVAPAPAGPVGTPITSPMNGIYYSAPSPNAPPFVREGDQITAGQIIALIEAMKVFNEVPSPLSGKVIKIVVTNGQVVTQGEVLMYVQ